MYGANILHPQISIPTFCTALFIGG